jgi:hypothetical protein
MLARQMLSDYYRDVTPSSGMPFISAHILDPFWKLRSHRKRDKEIDINPANKTSYTTKSQQPFLQYMENEYFPKDQPVPFNKSVCVPRNHQVPSLMSSECGQSSID